MKRDRTGDVIDTATAADELHVCADGWAGETRAGQPIPCPTCRPHLTRSPSGWKATAPRLREADWQARVIDLARLRGWRHFHAYSSQRSVPGWPDLALVRGDRLVFAELKTDTGRVRPEQEQWLTALSAVPGVEVHLWRPAHWQAVQEVLR